MQGVPATLECQNTVKKNLSKRLKCPAALTNKLRARLGISTETCPLIMQIIGSTAQMSVALQSFAVIT